MSYYKFNNYGKIEDKKKIEKYNNETNFYLDDFKKREEREKIEKPCEKAITEKIKPKPVKKKVFPEKKKIEPVKTVHVHKIEETKTIIKKKDKHMNMIVDEETVHNNLGEPKVWGPAFWFTLHNAAYHYPNMASPIVAIQTKKFIEGIPNMLPCPSCSIHARKYITDREDKLNKITSTKKELFKFFVDFHNAVNVRTGKPEMELIDVYKMYSNGTVTTFKNEMI